MAKLMIQIEDKKLADTLDLVRMGGMILGLEYAVVTLECMIENGEDMTPENSPGIYFVLEELRSLNVQNVIEWNTNA